MTGEFPAQRASNAETVSIWWRHHESFTCHDTIMYQEGYMDEGCYGNDDPSRYPGQEVPSAQRWQGIAYTERKNHPSHLPHPERTAHERLERLNNDSRFTCITCCTIIYIYITLCALYVDIQSLLLLYMPYSYNVSDQGIGVFSLKTCHSNVNRSP